MLYFLIILFVFMIAYGVAFTSIMEPQDPGFNMLRKVLYHPYFNIYGELFLNDPTGS